MKLLRYILAMVCLAVGVAACSPSQTPESARAWMTTHISIVPWDCENRVVVLPNPSDYNHDETCKIGASAYADIFSKPPTVWMDYTCGAGTTSTCIQVYRDDDWLLAHEAAHIADLLYASKPLIAWGYGDLVGREQDAQCIAEVWLGRPQRFPYASTADLRGYWDCPDLWVTETIRWLNLNHLPTTW